MLGRETREGRKRRLVLAAEQNHRCGYCGLAFEYDRGSAHPLSLTTDHVVPLGKQGRRTWENEIAACWACNQERGDRPADEFFAEVKARLLIGDAPPQRLMLERGDDVRRTRKRKQAGPTRRAPLVAELRPMTTRLIDYFLMTVGAEKTRELIATHGGQIELSAAQVAALTPESPLATGPAGRHRLKRRLRQQERLVGHTVTLGETQLAQVAERGTAPAGALHELLSAETLEGFERMRQWKYRSSTGDGEEA